MTYDKLHTRIVNFNFTETAKNRLAKEQRSFLIPNNRSSDCNGLRF
jgi:hypothetical protein